MILKTYKIIYNKGKTARPRVELGPSVPSLAKNARAYPTKKLKIMHQSIPPAPSTPPPLPGLLRGICLPCQSRGWGICKFCTARGPGICQPPGHSRAFDTHAGGGGGGGRRWNVINVKCITRLAFFDGTNPITEEGIQLRSPTPIMAPDVIHSSLLNH